MRKTILIMMAVSAIIAANFAPAASAQPKKTTKEKPPKMRDVTIYVYKRPPTEAYGTIVPVKRRIIDYAPLNMAMKLLLRGANEKEEETKGLEDFIYGLDFYSARIKNKTAQINFKFTEPEIALESWEGGGFDHENFVKAVNLTAKQFAGIERVSICVDGRKNYTNFDSSKEGKCSFPMFAPPPERVAPPNEVWDVKIFLGHEKTPDLPMGAPDVLPVMRRIKAADFLSETLKAFAAGATEDERNRGFRSIGYGAQFVSAKIQNKKAIVRFKMPPGMKFPDRFAAHGFYFAVTETVVQFWDRVNSVEVCVDEVMNFYAEQQKPIPCESENY